MSFIKTIRTAQQTSHSSGFRDFLFTKDGKTLISSSNDGTVKFWNLETGSLIKTILENASSIALSPNENELYVGKSNRTIKVFNIKKGNIVKIIKTHEHYVSSLKLTPDRSRLVSSDYANTIRFWDLDTWKGVNFIHRKGFGIKSFEVCPNGKNIILGIENGKIEIWNLKRSKCLKRISAHDPSYIKVLLSSNGKTLVSYDSKVIKIWDIYSGRCLKEYPYRYGVSKTISLSNNGDLLVYAKNFTDQISPKESKHRRFIYVESLKDFNSVASIEIDFNEYINILRFTLDGEYLVSGDDSGTIKVWDYKNSKVVLKIQGEKSRLVYIYNTLDGKDLITIEADGITKLWDISTEVCKTQFRMKDVYFSYSSSDKLALTPDGQFIVCGNRKGEIFVWQTSTGKKIHHIKAFNFKSENFEKPINSSRFLQRDPEVDYVSISHEGMYFIAIHRKRLGENLVGIWNIKTGKKVCSLTNPKGVGFYGPIVKDNLIISINWETVVRVVDNKNRKILGTFPLSSLSIASISNNGELIVLGGKDGLLKVYSANNCELIKQTKAY